MKSITLFAAILGLLGSQALHAQMNPAVEKAHAEIWRRFIDKHNVLLDFTELDGRVEIPTPEECQLGKPNALGWWSPIENGPMFNGLYMDAAVNRWRLTKSPDDAAKVRRLAEGLIFLAALSDVKGFVARGAATDGKSHYPMGSDDQTLPWFLGLWRYLESGLATAAERERIVAELVETAEAIVALGWLMPAEPPFGIRGSFRPFLFYSAPRLLFVAKLMHRLTNDAKWDELHRAALHERGGPQNMSRLELCERGLVFEHGGKHAWTASCPVAALRALWEMESDETIRAAYARGLAASVEVAAECLPLSEQFRNDDPRPFDSDWRRMNAQWKPQRTEQDAVELAQAQLKDFGKNHSPRRGLETAFVREPVFAAWIITLCPDRALVEPHRAAIDQLLAHYQYEKLHYSQFFPVESAWYRLRLLETSKASR